jgi:glutathione S-transferase
LKDDDGFHVYESRAICRYLTLKYGKESALMPPASDVKATAIFEQAVNSEAFNFDKYAAEICWEKVLKKYGAVELLNRTGKLKFPALLGRKWGQKTDEARVASLIETFKGKLAAYDQILGKQKYVAGDVRPSFRVKGPLISYPYSC